MINEIIKKIDNVINQKYINELKIKEEHLKRIKERLNKN